MLQHAQYNTCLHKEKCIWCDKTVTEHPIEWSTCENRFVKVCKTKTQESQS